MIQIDMPLPKKCDDCPCSYHIRTGPHEGELMCETLEYIGWDIDETIIKHVKRLSNCPMREVDYENPLYTA